MANWIFKMVYLTMQCITVATSLRTAFCITGQQVRLELFSKIRYLFLPHQRAFGPDSSQQQQFSGKTRQELR